MENSSDFTSYPHLNNNELLINVWQQPMFYLYGPGQRPDLAINKFFKNTLKNRPIQLFGDGNSSRDYTFIDDIICGFRLAIEYKSSNYEIINLGNNCSVTLSNLIIAIEQICNKKAILKRIPEQRGDVTNTFADLSKAQKLFGYKPKTSLNNGLQSYYNWYKKNQVSATC